MPESRNPGRPPKKTAQAAPPEAASKQHRPDASESAEAVKTTQKTSQPKPQIGRLLEHYRAQMDMSTQELADTAGVSYTLISGIENGKRPLSEAVLTKIALALGLTAIQEQGLREATQEAGGSSIFSGIYVSAAKLFEREMQNDIREVWVVDPSPAELMDPGWLEQVSKCMQQQARKYVYFLPTADIATDLRAIVSAKTSSAKVDQLVKFIVVPSSLHVFVFNPVKVFWRSNVGRHLGVCAFVGPQRSMADGGYRIDGGLKMDEYTHSSLVSRLQGIISQLEISPTYVLSDTVFHSWTAN